MYIKEYQYVIYSMVDMLSVVLMLVVVDVLVVDLFTTNFMRESDERLFEGL
jgi:hypothetical protein